MMELVEKLRACFFSCSCRGNADRSRLAGGRGGGGKIPYPLAPSPPSCFFLLTDHRGSYLLSKYFITVTKVRCHYLLSCIDVLRAMLHETIYNDDFLILCKTTLQC